MDKILDTICAQVKQRFLNVALAPHAEKTFPVGPASAKRLGYDAQVIDSLPLPVTESFAGVGNVLGIDELSPGEVVVDIGCGAGLDSILVASRVGHSGKVIGVDFTPEMIEKAKRNTELLGIPNIELRLGEVDALPLTDASADTVISNGVFNLCVDKKKVLAEVFRVLRPGGRFQMADILLEENVTPEDLARKGSWSD